MTTYGVDRTTGGGGSGSSTTVLLADGSQPLTADWDVGNFDITALSFYASGTSPVFSLTRALNSQDNAVVFNEADGSVRWRLTHVGTTDAFAIQRYNASGVLQDSPISVSNSDGKVTIAGDLVYGGIATADTYPRRNAGNTAWEAKTPTQVASELEPLMAPAWTTSYTPTVTPATGSITSYTATCRYQQIGKTVHATFTVSITNAGTGAGALTVTLPVAAAGGAFVGAGREYNNTGDAAQGYIIGGGDLVIAKYNNATLCVTNYITAITITYEAS